MINSLGTPGLLPPRGIYSLTGQICVSPRKFLYFLQAKRKHDRQRERSAGRTRPCVRAASHSATAVPAGLLKTAVPNSEAVGFTREIKVM